MALYCVRVFLETSKFIRNFVYVQSTGRTYRNLEIYFLPTSLFHEKKKQQKRNNLNEFPSRLCFTLNTVLDIHTSTCHPHYNAKMKKEKENEETERQNRIECTFSSSNSCKGITLTLLYTSMGEGKTAHHLYSLIEFHTKYDCRVATWTHCYLLHCRKKQQKPISVMKWICCLFRFCGDHTEVNELAKEWGIERERE